jgi:hypothetical protein
MLKTILTALAFPIALLFGPAATGWSNSRSAANDRGPSGTLQKTTVENGSATMDLDLNRLNEIKDLKNPLCFRGGRVRKIISSKCLA